MHRIAITRQTTCQRKNVDVRPGIAQRLHPFMCDTQRKNRYRDLWRFFSPFTVSCGDKLTAEWLEDLLSGEPRMPDIFRGLFRLELAKIYGRTGRLHDCSIQLTAAEAAFEICGHLHGALEVRKHRLHYGVTSSPNVLGALVKIMEQYCRMDCPLGVLQSASFPLAHAFENGDHRLYVKLQEILNDVCTVGGILHERLLLHLQLLASMNARTGHYAQVMELGSALYREFCARKWWTPAFHVTVVLSLAETAGENHQSALHWAGKGYELCKRESLEAESQAEYHVAQIRSLEPIAAGPSKAVRLQEIISLIERLVEVDVNASKNQDACTKLCLMASLQFQLARLKSATPDVILAGAYGTLDRACALCESLEARERAVVTGECQELRIAQLLFEGKHESNNDKEEQALRVADKLIELYRSVGLGMQEANKYRMRAMCNVQIWQKSSNRDCLVVAERDLKTACTKFRAASNSQAWLASQHELTRVYVTAWEKYGIPLDPVLEELQKLESIADRLRRELSALNGLPALLQKQRFASTTSVVDLYKWASGVNLAAQRYAELWFWSQKRKARSLSDMLGLGIIMPSTVKQAMAADPKIELEFQKLLAAQSRLANVSENERGFVREEIANLEGLLRPVPQFRDYLDLRDGMFKGFRELDALNDAISISDTPRNVIFVDWILYGDKIVMLVINSALRSAGVRLLHLTISVSDIDRWLGQNFREDRDRRDCLREDSIEDQYSPMRGLDPLISSLQQCTKPADLLIFSPTSCLNSLPLHALKIWDERCNTGVPLIARNPVVYAPSISVVQLCLARSRARESPNSAVFIGVYDIPQEAGTIYSQMDRLATSWNGRAACGEDVNKGSFSKLIDGASLVHYHGHCVFAGDNILQQSLVLSSGNEGGGTATTPDVSTSADETLPNILHASQNTLQWDDQQSATALEKITNIHLRPIIDEVKQETMLHLDSIAQTIRLTVEDIFALPLSSSPLVTLVACDSTTQTIATGDEPLGILTGLLCAGAASVVGASWPIPSRTGRMFSDAFYSDLNNQKSFAASKHNDNELVDIAVALQKAVLHIRNCKETSETYDWGAFSLWGSWLYKQ